MTTVRSAAITVQPMRWWHLEQVVAMEAQLFATDSPWSAEMFWSELAAEHHYVVATVPGPADDPQGGPETVIGYAGLAVLGAPPQDDAAEVRTIGVAAERRGRGLGRQLLQNLLAAAGPRQVLLEVRTDNGAAIELYRSEGFELLHRRRRYYQPSGADAYTMRRPAAPVTTQPGTTRPSEPALHSESGR